MGNGRKMLALVTSLRWRSRLAAVAAALDACNEHERSVLAWPLVEMLREFADGSARAAEVREAVMLEMIRRWPTLPPAVRHGAVETVRTGGGGWTGLCVRLAAEGDVEPQAVLASIACAAECGEPDAVMLLATLVADADRATSAAAEKSLLSLVDALVADGRLVEDAEAHAAVSRGVVRAVDALDEQRREGVAGDGKGVMRSLAAVIQTPARRWAMHERFGVMLGDDEHGVHRRLASMLRRDTDPRWRACAWTWLGEPGEGRVIGGERACIDRLSAAPAAVAPMPVVCEQAAVVERSHLLLNPVRAARIKRALSEREGASGGARSVIFGKWLPEVAAWSTLTTRQRRGVLDLAAWLGCDLEMNRAKEVFEPLCFAALGDADAQVRHRLVRMLAAGGSVMAIDLLADATFDADAGVARSAMLALCCPSGAWRDREGMLRLTGVCSTLQRSPHAALRHLGATRGAAINTWKSTHAEARLKALRLARLDPAGTRDAVLIEMECWPERPVDAVAASASAMRAGVDIGGELVELTTLLMEMPSGDRHEAHERALADAVKLLAAIDTPSHEPGAARERLHAWRDELLVQALHHDEPRVAANAVETIGVLARRAAAAGAYAAGPAGYLRGLLGDARHRVRANAAVALGRTRHAADAERAAATVGTMLADERSTHRAAGLWGIGAVAGALVSEASGTSLLISLGAEAARLAGTDPVDEVRWRAGRTAAMVLALLRSSPSVPREPASGATEVRVVRSAKTGVTA